MNLGREERKARFQELLKESGWSQAEAGRQLFVSSNHVHMIVQGKAVPSRSLLELLRLKVEEKKKEDMQMDLLEPIKLRAELAKLPTKKLRFLYGILGLVEKERPFS